MNYPLRICSHSVFIVLYPLFLCLKRNPNSLNNFLFLINKKHCPLSACSRRRRLSVIVFLIRLWANRFFNIEIRFVYGMPVCAERWLFGCLCCILCTPKCSALHWTWSGQNFDYCTTLELFIFDLAHDAWTSNNIFNRQSSFATNGMP